jgi:hypothetical protein
LRPVTGVTPASSYYRRQPMHIFAANPNDAREGSLGLVRIASIGLGRDELDPAEAQIKNELRSVSALLTIRSQDPSLHFLETTSPARIANIDKWTLFANKDFTYCRPCTPSASKGHPFRIRLVSSESPSNCKGDSTKRQLHTRWKPTSCPGMLASRSTPRRSSVNPSRIALDLLYKNRFARLGASHPDTSPVPISHTGLTGVNSGLLERRGGQNPPDRALRSIEQRTPYVESRTKIQSGEIGVHAILIWCGSAHFRRHPLGVSPSR